MREGYRILIGLVTATMLSWPASAAAASKKASSGREAVGTVIAKKVKDIAHTSVTIKTDQGQELVLELDYGTTVWKNNRPASVSGDLKVGEVIKVTYQAKGKQNIAKQIIIGRPPPRR